MQPFCQAHGPSLGELQRSCLVARGGFANSREWSARRACAELPDREWLTVKVFGWSWSGTAVAQRLRGSTYSTAFWARESWSMRCQSVSRLEARSNCWRVTHASSSCRSTRTCDSCIAIHPPLHEGRSDAARESATMSVGRIISSAIRALAGECAVHVGRCPEGWPVRRAARSSARR